MRIQNEKVIRAFLEHKAGHSPRRKYPYNGYYITEGSSIWTDGTDLYSYDTVIARWDGDKILVNTSKYSNTTTRQQSDLSIMLDRAGLECKEGTFEYNFGLWTWKEGAENE